MNRGTTAEECSAMITERDWQEINRALPSNLAIRARNRSARYRSFIEALVWVSRNRAYWSELPRSYGPWRSIYVRYVRWFNAGVWSAIDHTLDPESSCASALKSLLEDHSHAQQRQRLRSERKTT